MIYSSFYQLFKWGTQIAATRGRSSYTNLEWTRKDSKHELLAPIIYNMNKQKLNMNLKAMIGEL